MSDVIFTSFEKEEKSESKDKKIQIVKILVFLLGLLLLVEGILYTLVIPCFNRPQFSFNGLTTVRPEEIIAGLNGMENLTWAKFDTEKAVSMLGSVSCFESVSVEKHFPDKVVINITERIPVARTIVNVDGCAVPIQIDKNGVLFTVKPQKVQQDSSIPLISGLPVENIQEGMRLPGKFRGLIEQITQLPKKYFSAISEIQVVEKKYGNFELVLYPVSTKVRVLTDRALSEVQLKYMMVVLDVVNNIEPNVAEIDLRYGSVSYRKR